MALTPYIQEGWRTVRFMVAVTAVSIAAVSALHLASRERVRIFESQHLQRAVLAAAGIPPPGVPRDRAREFERRIRPTPLPNTGILYYQVVDPDADNRIVGYVFQETGAGLWGEIVAVVGLRADGETLTGIEFLKHNETPGLGARIEEPAFKKQFAGKRAPLTPRSETGPARDTEFDAITGATQTSRAVVDILNRAIEDARGALAERAAAPQTPP